MDPFPKVDIQGDEQQEAFNADFNTAARVLGVSSAANLRSLYNITIVMQKVPKAERTYS